MTKTVEDMLVAATYEIANIKINNLADCHEAAKAACIAMLENWPTYEEVGRKHVFKDIPCDPQEVLKELKND